MKIYILVIPGEGEIEGLFVATGSINNLKKVIIKAIHNEIKEDSELNRSELVKKSNYDYFIRQIEGWTRTLDNFIIKDNGLYNLDFNSSILTICDDNCGYFL